MSSRNFFAWKLAELICYLLAAVGAVVMSVTVGNAPLHFGNKCPLYTRLNFRLRTNVSEGSVPEIEIVDDDVRLWESYDTCELSTFLPVGCAAYALVMAYFILMCDRVEKLASGSESRNRMLGMFYPLVLGSLVLSVLMLVASIRTTNGTDVFCNTLYDAISVDCIDASDYRWRDYPDAYNFYQTLLAAIISGWLSTTGCLLSLVVLVLRCFAGVDRVQRATHMPLPLRESSPITTVVSLDSSFKSDRPLVEEEQRAGPSGVLLAKSSEVDV